MAEPPKKETGPKGKPSGFPDQKSPLRDALVSPTSVFVENLLRNNRLLEALGPTFVGNILPLSAPVGTLGSLLTLGEPFLKKQHELEKEISALRRQIQDQAQALDDKKSFAEESKGQVKELEQKLLELSQKQRLGFLLNCVDQNGQRALLQSENFQKLFLEQRECLSLVISVDIRRSTELMLKARTPEAFAAFITTLCSDLMDIIKQSYGVIDKFTGDGVLGFFPDFYSQQDMAYYAVSAADKCHAAFKRHYKDHRRSFKSILNDVGLGIGIDYGTVHLVQIAGGLTVVGEPVVYACRLSGAPAGVTLLNQPAYDEITDRFGKYCFTTERLLEIKHEGTILAYAVNLNGKSYSAAIPEWVSTIIAEAGS